MSGFYNLFDPIIRFLEPEVAHGLALKALRYGLFPYQHPVNDPSLAVNVFGIKFPNPIGLAAGFDKNAEIPDALLGLGYGFVEVGSITPKGQFGNPKPRLFRLSRDRAVINRMGFNNNGAEAARELLLSRSGRTGIVGINLGKNRETDDALSDYTIGVNLLAPFASYIVINISSPNTPGLRALQGRKPLQNLLRGVRKALCDSALEKKPPLLLKIAPDLTNEDKQDIASVVIAEKIDGIIATNTTIERPDSLTHPLSIEKGGLSGQPLFDLSTSVLTDMYNLTEGKIPLIGVGGVSDASTAYLKIRAGASLVQLYSAMVYEGPGVVIDILKGLVRHLKADGFMSVKEAIGADS